ncbi:hypothetical protein [Hymenobacter weizhouensis]|uniref:hypothetical protein n=1 Tax=Hymenobacter sp. YIM 151500-1 TaxID=2987689 RepID=UPI0022275B4F|nr:hypothetical protein [Hymenobacter sp. YIM 151500-1]UYZ64408.1 hypothetical protein OIS53_06035 [Hymenobacter sp. YIM 151500-1]
MGRLFNQYLHHKVDGSGFESYLYLSNDNPEKGALLNVFYYRCAHCQAQYLVLYQTQLKDDRPLFEPNEILIKSIYQVAFDHDKLTEILELPSATQAAN